MAVKTAGTLTNIQTWDLLDLTSDIPNDITGVIVFCVSSTNGTLEIPGLHASGEAMPMVANQIYTFRNEYGLTQLISGGTVVLDFAINERSRPQPVSMRGHY